LGGDGGDELFGGYTLYSWVLRQQRLRNHLPRLARSLVGYVGRKLPVGVRGRTYMQSVALDPIESIARTGLYFDQPTRERLAPSLRALQSPRAELFRAHAAARGTSILQQLTIADFASYLPNDILVKVDRASMLNSLEIRAPFLDHRIITFAYGRVPDVLRCTPFERKVLLRKLGARVLPPSFDLKRKQGFTIPLSAWFKGEWGPYMADAMLSADDSPFDRAVIRQLISSQRRGFHNAQRLFALTMFELWRREYKVELPA
jgi:asparagine synthase (glutamine-hydrolysing)